MNLSILTRKWCGLSDGASVVIVTDSERLDLAEEIASGFAGRCRIVNFDICGDFMPELRELNPCDLVIALFSFDTFVRNGANRFFSPFAKPDGIAAKYAFIRLGISKESLLQGLSTPKKIVFEKIAELQGYGPGSVLRVTNAAGTDITLEVDRFTTCSNEIAEDGGMAFLPPSEVSAEVKRGTANGKIAVDITIGQLYNYGELLGSFGLVSKIALLTVQNGIIAEITGGVEATELKEKLFALPPGCRELVELGHGLSQMSPTGIIGVDESIIDTCHFGIGDAGSCGTHLDVVIGEPKISKINNKTAASKGI